MTPLRARIEKQLRERVCSVCFSRMPDGSCGLPVNFSCPLFEHLDEVIDVVAHTSGESIDPYVDRLRTMLCSHCHTDDAGHCPPRDHLECALDMYLPLIVEIVETELKCEV